VGALIRRNGEVLLIKRATEPNKGRWTLPGGLVELGEEARAAIRREVLEEVGLTVDVEALIGVLDIIKRDSKGKVEFHFVTIDFLAKPVGGTLKPNREVEDARWVNPSEIRRLDLTPSVKRIIRQVGFADPTSS
jgi:ADP-ribose pyrophosphatase YjhB (NUDIX family)